MKHEEVYSAIRSLAPILKKRFTTPSYVRLNGEMIPCYKLSISELPTITAWVKDERVSKAFTDAGAKLSELVLNLLRDPKVLKRVKAKEADVKVHSIQELLEDFEAEILNLQTTMSDDKYIRQNPSFKEACSTLTEFQDALNDLWFDVLELKQLV